MSRRRRQTLKRPRVLFIAHDASRTGAPMVLLHLLQWIRSEGKIDFEVLLRDRGDLEQELAKIATVTLLPPPPETDGLRATTLRRIGATAAAERGRRARLSATMRRRGFDLVYSNTMTNGRALEWLSELGCPVVTHAHELEHGIRYAGETNLAQVLRRTTHWIACAHAVRDQLIARHGVDARRIDVIHEFIPIQRGDQAARPGRAAEIRKALGIPPDAFVVGGSGTTDWRKGPDLFVVLARAIRSRRPDAPIRFVWVGGFGPGAPRFAALQHDIESARLGDVVHFVGAHADPSDHFAAFDAFALVSREDPYPLACLEVAAMGTPIVCFDASGGEREFVEQDCGFVVPYLDIGAMADRLLELADDAPLRRRLGANAAAKVRARHDIAIVAPRVVKTIERCVAEPDGDFLDGEARR